jgi:glycosyl hydrolase family 2
MRQNCNRPSIGVDTFGVKSFRRASRRPVGFFSVLIASSAFAVAALSAETLPLDGAWRFQLDRAGAGVSERWYERALSSSVRLPGTLAAQGIGDEVRVDTGWIGTIVDRAYFEDSRYEPYRKPGNIKVPFWLQPDKYYAGAAWYQRDIEIPASWKGRRFVLLLERPHWQTRVWLNSREIGSDESLATPHRYDLGFVAPGRHTLTIRVDNSLVVDIGVNSHSISDHTQGNWNGIVGRLALESTGPVWIEDLQTYPDVRTRTVRMRGRLRNTTGQEVRAKISVSVEAGPGAQPIKVPPAATEVRSAAGSVPVEVEISLGKQAQLWDEFMPALYRLRLALEGMAGGTAVADERTVTIGLREISTAGTQLALNGRKLFLRGTLECAVFPKTGHPPVDVESWRKILRIARAHGLNHFRFHSWCPPEAAFAAGDELGFYYQVEASSWPNGSTSLGDGKPVDAWIDKETARILESYGNHPSFVMMAAGNEPGGDRSNAWLGEWLKRNKARDPRRLFTSGSGWPQLAGNDYHVTPDPRIQHWEEGLKSRVNSRPPETRSDYRDYIAERALPVVSHEIGQWCVFPNFAEIPKYTGYLKPRNFEIFRDWLDANHMGDQARDFLMASGKLQTICYKEDIESALRTPGMAGFQLLQLNDFPGQGTALVGVLDPFWESKGYVTAAEFSRFTNATVPLARLEKHVFTSGETLSADIEVSHFGPAPLPAAVARWKLVGDSGGVAARGALTPDNIPAGCLTALGRVTIGLANIPAPARYKLVVGIEGTPFENDWDVWVYPTQVDVATPAGVTIVRELDDQAVAKLESGQTVFLMIPRARVRGDKRGPVQLGFSSIFWNTAWTKGQAPHTLGILCDPKHPALAAFPTESHSNWQWWYLVTSAGAMILDGLPHQTRPIVQVIDDWFQARRLGLVLEARVGAGKLLVTSMDLQRSGDPVSRQMLASLLGYISGPKFRPATQLTLGQVRELMN